MVTPEQLEQIRALYRREIAAAGSCAETMASWIDAGIELRRTVLQAQANLTRALEQMDQQLDD